MPYRGDHDEKQSNMCLQKKKKKKGGVWFKANYALAHRPIHYVNKSV